MQPGLIGFEPRRLAAPYQEVTGRSLPSKVTEEKTNAAMFAIEPRGLSGIRTHKPSRAAAYRGAFAEVATFSLPPKTKPARGSRAQGCGFEPRHG